MSGQDDAIAALAGTLDALDTHIQTADATVKRSERNRLGLLHLHAFAAVLMAPLFAAVGKDGMAGATWTVVRLIPGTPFTLAAVLFAGGLILGVATVRRSLWWEKLGLWMLLVWYATIAVSFGGAVVMWVAHGMPGGPAKPSTYPPILYTHLTAIMAVHLRTLYRMTSHRRLLS